MIDLLGVWVAPLLLIPGKGLLTISTAAQFNQALALSGAGTETPEQSRRLLMLRRALISLYLGIGVDALAALGGGLLHASPALAFGTIVIGSCLGVGCLLAAIVFLILEIYPGPAKPLLHMENS